MKTVTWLWTEWTLCWNVFRVNGGTCETEGERLHPFKSISERAQESSWQVGVARAGGDSSGSVPDWPQE